MRKLSIVIEEVTSKQPNGDTNFIVYLEGDKERLSTTPDKDLTAAEFWAKKLFEICASVLRESGAAQG